MVFYGISRACNSCKKRRKKCDLTRPSCMRCTRANRTCSGYEDNALSAFRQYGPPMISQASLFVTTARKCTLPKRVPAVANGALPKDVGPPETSIAESNALSLRAFFFDFCVIPTNSQLSRGFLAGLEAFAHRLGPKSDLVKACQAVAFACHAKPLNRPQLIQRAEGFHQQLLGSLARAIKAPNTTNDMESRLVAMLLGLYQISAASLENHGNHQAHARGLAALLETECSPLNLLSPSESGSVQTSIKRPLVSGVFSIPPLMGQWERLDRLILDLDLLWSKYDALPVLGEPFTLRNECIELHQRFAQWERYHDQSFNPTEVAVIGKRELESETEVGCWPGRVDTYFDLYVAGVWNIIRVARLLLIALIIELSINIDDGYSTSTYINTGNILIEDILASIPYHLTDNLHLFVSQLESRNGIGEPGKLLGGFLLLHPLYIATRMPFVPKPVVEYMQRCLLWIGSNMGIGQATVFAKTQDVEREYVESGCMLIWAGFLA